MKNTTFLTAAFVALALGANAQTVTTDSSATANAALTAAPAVAAAPKYKTQNSTADSIAAKYKLLPMPGELTLDKKFPVIGTYQLAGSTDASTAVTVTLDSNSKGIVWINGLPQGTFKAYLAKSPATYRIIQQKSVSGTSVPEGTLVFSPETNTLQVALGAPFNSENPAAIFPVVAATDASVAASEPVTAEVKVKKASSKGKLKSKNKVIFYTASKVDALSTTSSNAAFGQQLQQAQQQ